MILDLMTTLNDAALLAAETSSSSQDGPPYWVLAAGPVGGAGTYWLIYRYYRNQDKSHHFERDTLIKAKPVKKSDKVVDRIGRTRDSDIDGDNSSDYRERVKRVASRKT